MDIIYSILQLEARCFVLLLKELDTNFYIPLFQRHDLLGPEVQTCRVLIGKEILSTQSPKNNVNTFSGLWKIMPKNSNISKAHEKRSQISYTIKSPFHCAIVPSEPFFQSQQNLP